MMYRKSSSLLAFGLAVSSCSPVFAKHDGYFTNLALQNEIRQFASSSDLVSVSSIGESLGGEPILLITLSGTASGVHTPAMLITAGIDGRHLVGTETAVRVAKQIVDEHSDVLDSMTIYIIPRANPDGATINMKSLTMGYAGNRSVVDDDRDRETDEDGPDDLNGDGYITMMRRMNPTLDDPATHMADPDEARLNVKPDSKEGQRASFTLYSEGIDNDGDGKINEDGFGFVDLDQNFMHRWPEYSKHSGVYQLSEPESHALATFVSGKPQVVMAITLGRHDNLVNAPDSKAKDITGRAPKVIDSKDAELYKYVSELYKESVGLKSAPKEDIAGSFHAWLYAQRGVPSFATTVWGRPQMDADEESKDAVDADASVVEAMSESSGLTPSGVGDISQETLDELMAAYEEETGEQVDESMMAMVTPEMVEGFALQAGITVQRVTASDDAEDGSIKDANKSDEKNKAKKKKNLSEDAQWLAYFEQEGIQGFIDWEPFEHPTLGDVEIGGFVPLARMNPPAAQLDDIATKHTAFVVDLIGSRPRINVVEPEVNQIAQGIYEVRFAIINEGELPTSTVYSRTSRTVRPVVVRISSQVDHILTGQRVSRVWGLDANGGRSDHHWIIRTEQLSSETIEIIDPRFGNHTIQLGDES